MSHISRRPWARSWIVVLVLVLSGLLVPATAANASTAKCTGSGGFAWISDDGGSPHCMQGRGLYVVAGQGPYGLLVNNTGVRVWFHQTSSGTGWADCFSHGNAFGLVGSRDENPGSVEVTTNGTQCTSTPSNVTVQCAGYGAMAFVDAPNLCYYSGNTYNMTGVAIGLLTNGSGDRVWLHQNANGTGWADCFSNDNVYFLTGRDTSPGNLQVTTNPAAC